MVVAGIAERTDGTCFSCSVDIEVIGTVENLKTLKDETLLVVSVYDDDKQRLLGEFTHLVTT